MWIITNCGKLLKRYQTILPVSWETWMRTKKQQLEPCMEHLMGSRLRKEDDRAVCCHPACLTYMLSTSWERPGCWVTSWNQDKREKHQQSQICRWYHPYRRKWREIEEPLHESERGERKSWLKTNIQKSKIMACGPITLWQRDGETMETVTHFIFLGSKITADGDCSHVWQNQYSIIK